MQREDFIAIASPAPARHNPRDMRDRLTLEVVVMAEAISRLWDEMREAVGAERAYLETNHRRAMDRLRELLAERRGS